jgi:hypothetical protein
MKASTAAMKKEMKTVNISAIEVRCVGSLRVFSIDDLVDLTGHPR